MMQAYMITPQSPPVNNRLDYRTVSCCKWPRPLLGRVIVYTTLAIYRLSRYFFTIFIVDEILTIAHPYLLTNQALAYNESRNIQRLAVPRLENVDKTLKLNPSINLGISSDLGIAILRFNPS